MLSGVEEAMENIVDGFTEHTATPWSVTLTHTMSNVPVIVCSDCFH
jgi:hypothetical protein